MVQDMFRTLRFGFMVYVIINFAIAMDTYGAGAREVPPSFALSPRSKITGATILSKYGLIGSSPAIQRLYHLIQAASKTDKVVLITGETGTGKELVAQAIHMESDRKDGLFIAVNVTEMSPTLMESELFGHTKGAFTDAVADRIGYFEAADGGVLYLDEVGDLPPAAQGYLLSAIEDRKIIKLGTTWPKDINVKIIATTNKDLDNMVKQGKFREDLFYRLDAFKLHIPPLRQRREDIIVLAQYYLRQYAEQLGIRRKSLSKSAKRLLYEHNWPGNVRELQSVILRAIIFEEGQVISPDSLLLDRAGPRAIFDAKIAPKISQEDIEFKEILNREGIVGEGDWMLWTSKFIRRVSQFELPCLIAGKSGTGMDLLVEMIRRHGRRHNKPFIQVNCTSLIDNPEDKLFGHVRGAFTGAIRDMVGFLERANGGILLLDEVSSLTATAQAKLLRVLQEKEYRRVGETETRKIDVQVIATTNKDLERLVREGLFRADLYYRLNVMRLDLPPLFERPDEILILAENFLRQYSQKYNRKVIFDPMTIELIKRYHWPGNIRELDNRIDQAVLINEDGIIKPEDLALSIPDETNLSMPPEDILIEDYLKWGPVVIEGINPNTELSVVREEVSRAFVLYGIKKILSQDKTKVSKLQMAKSLGMSRQNFYGLMKKFWGTTEIDEILSMEEKRRKNLSIVVKVHVTQDATYRYGLDLAVEKAILATLARHHWNVARSAESLGIGRAWLVNSAHLFWRSVPTDKTKILQAIFEKMERGYDKTKIKSARGRIKDISDEELMTALKEGHAARSLGITADRLRHLLNERNIRNKLKSLDTQL